MDTARLSAMEKLRHARQKVGLITVLDLEYKPHRELIDEAWLELVPQVCDQLAEAEARIATLEVEKAELQREIDGPEAEDFVSLTQQLKEMTDTWRLVEGKLDAAKVEIAQLRATRERGVA